MHRFSTKYFLQEPSNIYGPSTSRGLAHASTSSVTDRKPPKRSKSANFPRASVPSRSGHALLKNHPAKHSTIAVVKPRTRPDTTHQSFTEETPGKLLSCTPGRNDREPIDRILLRDVVGIGTPWKQTIVQLSAPAIADASTGMDASQDMNAKEDTRGSWLRSSMRRLQHFRLPSTLNDDGQEASASGSTAETEDNARQIVAPPSVDVSSSVRPVSAPSRLPDCVGTRESGVESRNAVSNVPTGRPRSNSNSSRTRRHTSLSSSESSLASSADDTSPTCTPSPTAVRSNQEQIPSNNNSRT